MRHALIASRGRTCRIKKKALGPRLICTLGIWGWYFWVLIGQAASGALLEHGFVSTMGAQFASSVTLSIVVGIGVELLVEALTRKSDRGARDEREAWAGLRATRIAHGVLITLIFSLSALGFLFGAFGGEGLAARSGAFLSLVLSNGLVLFANGALFALILAEVAHDACLIFFLRRGR